MIVANLGSDDSSTGTATVTLPDRENVNVTFTVVPDWIVPTALRSNSTRWESGTPNDTRRP